MWSSWWTCRAGFRDWKRQALRYLWRWECVVTDGTPVFGIEGAHVVGCSDRWMKHVKGRLTMKCILEFRNDDDHAHRWSLRCQEDMFCLIIILIRWSLGFPLNEHLFYLCRSSIYTRLLCQTLYVLSQHSIKGVSACLQLKRSSLTNVCNVEEYYKSRVRQLVQRLISSTLVCLFLQY